MLQLPTVILEHTVRDNRHHDLMIADPACVGRSCDLQPSGLWTLRIGPEPGAWVRLGVLEAVELKQHRPDFLQYQGWLTRDRGCVRQVGRGWCLPLLWVQDRRIIRLRTPVAAGVWELRRLGGAQWRMSLR